MIFDRKSALPAPRRAARYVEISTSGVIQTAVDRAVTTGKPSRVIGPSGVGKSAAIAELLHSHLAVGCTITAAHQNVRGVLRLLFEVYGFTDPGRNSLIEMERGLIEDLSHRRRMMGGLDPVILDEYQNIQPLALRELLTLQEHLGIPLICVGNGETIAQRNKVDQLRAMEQITNRFKFKATIEGLLDSDFDLIAAEWNVEQVPATRAVVAAYGRNHSLHQLTMLLADARSLAAIGPTRLEHLRAVVQLYDPDRLPLMTANRGLDEEEATYGRRRRTL